MSEEDINNEDLINDEEIKEVDEIEDQSISDVDIDEIADVSIEVLQTILKAFDVGEITIDEYEGDEQELILDITGEDLAVLIGRHGRTLNAIQSLVSAIVRKRIGFRYPIVVDIEGYKNRQRERLESIANNSAHRAVAQSKKISLQPMSPYERRIIHITLKDNPEVDTESEGTGPQRHVVIIPLTH